MNFKLKKYVPNGSIVWWLTCSILATALPHKTFWCEYFECFAVCPAKRIVKSFAHDVTIVNNLTSIALWKSFNRQNDKCCKIFEWKVSFKHLWKKNKLKMQILTNKEQNRCELHFGNFNDSSDWTKKIGARLFVSNVTVEMDASLPTFNSIYTK